MPSARGSFDARPLQEELPSSSFVSFTAQRLAKPWLAYVNSDAPTDVDWLGEFAYLVPSVGEHRSDFLPDTKQFLAERYGGAGLLTHGGGARVGLAQGYQVKGIGCNPLCGVTVPARKVHFTGALTLAEAIQEAAWGEILFHALPYRATRIAAVLGTGTSASSARGSEFTKVPRALVVREAAVRPGHFFRTTYFRPAAQVPLLRDADRVATVIQCLPQLLPIPAEAVLKRMHLSCFERLTLGLQEFARRSAEQCAAARAMRLMHGGLAASNVGLDGRWLDYGTVSALPSYANTHNFGLPRHISTFWEDHLPCLSTIRDLCFFATKYLRRVGNAEIDAAQLRSVFHSHYDDALRRHFLALAGIPENFYASGLKTADRQHIAETFLRIAKCGVATRFYPTTADLTEYGSNNLGLALIVLALGASKESTHARLCAVLESASQAEQLLLAYSLLVDASRTQARRSGIGDLALQRVTLVNAAKRAFPALELYRDQMENRCQALVGHESGAGSGASLAVQISAYIEQLKALAQRVLTPRVSVSSMTWREGCDEVYFDAVTNRWQIRRGGYHGSAPWSAIADLMRPEPSLELFGDLERSSRTLLRP